MLHLAQCSTQLTESFRPVPSAPLPPLLLCPSFPHTVHYTLPLCVRPIQRHAEREECYQSLQRHRVLLTSDRYMFDEHGREHDRLKNIARRTEEQFVPLDE